VFGSDLSFGGGSPRGADQAGAVRAMLCRGRALVDTHRPEGGYPLEWHVTAMLVGDLPAIAAAAVRAFAADSGPGAISDR
jgi:hypothetical protein